MIGVLGNDRALVAGYGPCNSEGQVIGLGTGADKHAHGQLARQRVGKHLGVLDNRVVQVTRMRIQCRDLFRDRLSGRGRRACERGSESARHPDQRRLVRRFLGAAPLEQGDFSS